MSKVTSKRQVTIPKEVADRYRIEPGDEIEWVPYGDQIRVVRVSAARRAGLTIAARLKLFDRATERRDRRFNQSDVSDEAGSDRGWTRDELHDRGSAAKRENSQETDRGCTRNDLDDRGRTR